MTNLRGGKTMAVVVAAAAALFAAGCAAPSSTPVAAHVRSPRAASKPAASKPAKRVTSPRVRHTVTAAQPPSAPVQTYAAPAPAPTARPPAPTVRQPGPSLEDAIPASSSTPAPPPSTIKPPPCAFGFCVPWVWYKATSVINNNALLPIPTFGSSLDNNVPGSSKLTDTVTGSVTVSAQLSGKGGESGPAIGGAIAELDPQVGASATITETKTVEISVPHGDQGVIMFGVPAVEVNGYLYTRDVLGHVTRTPMRAWAPLYPAVFGFNAYVTPLAGRGPQSEVPVIPIPAG